MPELHRKCWRNFYKQCIQETFVVYNVFFPSFLLLVPARQLLHQRALSKTLWWKCRVNVMQRVRLLWIDWVSGQAGVSAERSSQSVVQVSAIVLRLEQEMASNVYGAARLSMDAAVVAAISTCNFLSKASSQDDSVFGMFSAGQRLRSEDTIAGESEIVRYIYI